MFYFAILLLGLTTFFVFIQRKSILSLKKEKKDLLLHIDELSYSELDKNQDDDFTQAEMRRLSIVAKQTDNAIMIMDPDGNIEWINDGFTRMYEYTFEEFIKIRGSNILQTSFNPAVQERLERCKRTKEPVYYEAINVSPSGKEIWTHTSLTPIFDDNGEIIHLATIDSDISKRKAAGDALLEGINSFTHKINHLAKQQQALVEFTYTMMEDVRHSSKRIGETDRIVKFIREMSDKIRIMGLNASIEAHSAGQIGSGFRVLSNEIVKMSDETKNHAQEIFNIVESIKGASDRLNDGKNQVETATDGYMRAVEELRIEVNRVEEVAAALN